MCLDRLLMRLQLSEMNPTMSFSARPTLLSATEITEARPGASPLLDRSISDQSTLHLPPNQVFRLAFASFAFWGDHRRQETQEGALVSAAPLVHCQKVLPRACRPQQHLDLLDTVISQVLSSPHNSLAAYWGHGRVLEDEIVPSWIVEEERRYFVRFCQCHQVVLEFSLGSCRYQCVR